MTKDNSIESNNSTSVVVVSKASLVGIIAHLRNSVLVTITISVNANANKEVFHQARFIHLTKLTSLLHSGSFTAH